MSANAVPAPERPVSPFIGGGSGRWLRVPDAPGWFGAAVCGLAVFGAACVVGESAGLALSALGVATSAILACALNTRDRWALASFAVAGLLFSVATLRDAGWVVTLSVIAGVGFLAVGTTSGWSWRALVAALLRPVWRALPGPVVVVALATRDAGTRGWSRFVPAVRGLVLAGVLLLVFLPLFAAADAAFAELLDDALFGWSLDRPVSRSWPRASSAYSCASALRLVCWSYDAHSRATRATSAPRPQGASTHRTAASSPNEVLPAD